VASPAIDDYLKTIYHHTEWQDDRITPSQLAGVWGGRRLEQHAVAQRQHFERALSRLEFDYAPAEAGSAQMRRRAA